MSNERLLTAINQHRPFSLLWLIGDLFSFAICFCCNRTRMFEHSLIKEHFVNWLWALSWLLGPQQ